MILKNRGMFRYTEEEVINSSLRLGDEGETLFGANSQTMHIHWDPKEKLSTVGAYIAYEEDLMWFWKSS